MILKFEMDASLENTSTGASVLVMEKLEILARVKNQSDGFLRMYSSSRAAARKQATFWDFTPCLATVSHSASLMAQTAHFAGTLRQFDELSKVPRQLDEYPVFIVAS